MDKMTLSELYSKGKEAIESQQIGLYIMGVETEYVLRHNEEIFKKYQLYPNIIGSRLPTLDTNILGLHFKTPILMSAMASPIPQIHMDGLLMVARALRDTGSMMFVGSPMPSNLKELVEVGVPVAQTVKPYADRSKLMKQIEAAEKAGVAWIGLEVDAGMGTKILDRPMVQDCSPLSVGELKEIKARTSLPLVLKGILSEWDAEKALEIGADAIVVSNHGAHTVDYLPHPLEVMDRIVRVVRNQIPIIVDGGFRRGSDVLKGLAFGAQAVGVGRPILYGLAAGGEKGVRTVISEMSEELSRAMIMTGLRTPKDANKGIILSPRN